MKLASSAYLSCASSYGICSERLRFSSHSTPSPVAPSARPKIQRHRGSGSAGPPEASPSGGRSAATQALSQPALAALVAFHVLETLAFAAADAQVELLDVLVVGQVGVAPKLDLGRIFEERINEIIDRRFAASPSEPVEELGTIDAPPTFDIETAVRNFDDPQRVMNEWFRFEGRDYPEDYGVVFFQGWSSYSSAEKIEAVRDAKKVLDRTLKAK